MQIMVDFLRIAGFDWDDENNWKKVCGHGISQAEAEPVFFSDPLLVVHDLIHSTGEMRFHALGRTDEARLLHMSFTLRDAGTLIRVISARDMSRKERTRYAKEPRMHAKLYHRGGRARLLGETGFY